MIREFDGRAVYSENTKSTPLFKAGLLVEEVIDEKIQAFKNLVAKVFSGLRKAAFGNTSFGMRKEVVKTNLKGLI